MKFCRIIFSFLFYVYMFTGVNAEMREFTSMSWGDTLNLYDDAIIYDDGWVDFVDINVKRTLLIENDGVLAGRINICDGCTLLLQNNGDISGVHFVPGAHARLTQVIFSESDVTYLDTDMNYVILVKSPDGLSLNQIVDIAGPDAKIVLENTSLVLDSIITDAPEIKLSGNVDLVLKGVTGDVPLLDNIDGDGVLNVYATTDNALMITRAEIVNHKLYVQMLRETDYVKILQNPTGEFLNSLRSVHPDDKLLRALDRAGGMSALDGIMSRSVRLRPINLMRPVRVMDAMEIFAGVPSGTVGGFMLSPDFIYNDDFYITGLRIGISGQITDTVSAGASGYVGYVSASDEINNFEGRVFSGNGYAMYDDGEFIGRAILGHSTAKFDIDFILVGDDVGSAPCGTNSYGATDFGVRLNPMDDFVFSPFIGLTATHTDIATTTENNFDANVGTDITTTGGTDDFSYNYGLRVRASASGDTSAAIRIAFWSRADDAGVDMNVGIINSEFGTAYRASVGGRAIF